MKAWRRGFVLCLCAFLLVPVEARGESSLDMFRKQQMRKKLKKQAEERERRKKAEAFHKKVAPVLLWSGVAFSAVGALTLFGPTGCVLFGLDDNTADYKGACQGDSALVWFSKNISAVAAQSLVGGGVLLVGAVLLQVGLLIEPGRKVVFHEKAKVGPVLMAVGGGVTLVGLVVLGQGVFRILDAENRVTGRSGTGRLAMRHIGIQQSIGGSLVIGIGVSFLVTGSVLWRQ